MAVKIILVVCHINNPRKNLYSASRLKTKQAIAQLIHLAAKQLEARLKFSYERLRIVPKVFQTFSISDCTDWSRTAD